MSIFWQPTSILISRLFLRRFFTSRQMFQIHNDAICACKPINTWKCIVSDVERIKKKMNRWHHCSVSIIFCGDREGKRKGRRWLYPSPVALRLVCQNCITRCIHSFLKPKKMSEQRALNRVKDIGGVKKTISREGMFAEKTMRLIFYHKKEKYIHETLFKFFQPNILNLNLTADS